MAGGRSVGLGLRAKVRLAAGRYQLVVVTGDGRGHITVARHRVWVA